MNDSPASSGEPSSGIGKLVSLADTFAKLGVGVIALYGAYYLFITEETKQCNSIVQALYKVVQERSYPNDAIERIVQISDPGNCNFATKGLAQALAAISEGGGHRQRQRHRKQQALQKQPRRNGLRLVFKVGI